MDPLLPLRRIMWIGLNPSTADEQQLDPTLRRIRGFSQAWGFTAFVMTNVFAFRATVPADMKAQADPVGQDNDYWLGSMAKPTSCRKAFSCSQIGGSPRLCFPRQCETFCADMCRRGLRRIKNYKHATRNSKRNAPWRCGHFQDEGLARTRGKESEDEILLLLGFSHEHSRYPVRRRHGACGAIFRQVRLCPGNLGGPILRCHCLPLERCLRRWTMGGLRRPGHDSHVSQRHQLDETCFWFSRPLARRRWLRGGHMGSGR